MTLSTRLLLRAEAPVLLALWLLIVPAGVQAAANANLALSFISVDPACELPVYSFVLTADHTVNDDPSGNDWVAIIVHDGTGHILRNIWLGVLAPQTVFGGPLEPTGTLDLTSFFSSRPLTIRVHDIPAPPASVSEASHQGMEWTLGSPVLFETTVDPADDASECAGLPVHDAGLRTKRLTNATQQLIGNTAAYLDLDGSGTTQLAIGAPVGSMLVAFLSAECSNDGAGYFGWAEITIRVDGVDLSPTVGDSAFCSSNNLAGFDEWVMARTSAATAVTGPGVHTVQVLAKTVGNGATSRIQDTSLVVLLPEPSPGLLRWSGLAGLAALVGLRHRRARRRALRLALLVPAFVVAAAAPSARADTLIHKSGNAAVQIFTGTGLHTLDLGEGNGVSLQFLLTRAAELTIAFSAECAVDAPDTTTWLDLDVLVNGIPAAPTDTTLDAFCTSWGGGTGRWVSAAVNAVASVGTGLHTIRVEGVLQSGAAGDSWWIDDLSLIVIVIEK